MPLTSIVSAASMAVFGPTYVAGTVPLVILSALVVPLTYLVTIEIWGSRGTALLAAVLAIFAGPLFIMYPTTDNFAVFGATGAASLYCSMRAIRATGPGPWLVAAGAFAGLATLSRIDGVFLAVGVAVAWLVRRGWTPWRPRVFGGASIGWGVGSAAAFLAVLAPGSRGTSRSSADPSHRPGVTRCGSPSTTSSSRSATRSAWPPTSTGAGNIIGSKLV